MRLSSRLLPAAWLAVAFCGSTGISLSAADPPETIRRTAWSFDRSEITWYDSSKAEEKKKQGIINEMFGWAEYDVVIPADNWYELWETGGVAEWPRDLFVDGKMLLSLVISEKEDVANKPGKQEGWYKECNLWLTKGKHRLRFRRLSFPGVLPSAFELVPAAGQPTCSVFAEKEGFDVLRVGEQYKIKVTAGATKSDLRIEIVLKSRLASPEMLPAGEVTFSASRQLRTKTVAIDCAKEGVYQVVARMDGKLLRPSEFRGGQFAVVDVAEKLRPDDRKTIVHDIDCVANTDLGRPIDPATFFECNGKTRISATKAGKYRESNDCTGPGVEKPASPGDPRSYSGFAYALDLPDDSAVYLLEMEYPDDDRRSVTVPISFLSEDKGELLNGSYSGKSWETGGIFPLSWKMNAHRMVFWAVSKKMNVGILGQQIGHRAAASRIRVYKFGGKLPVERAANPSGRTFCHWYEEGDSLKFVVNSNRLYGTMPEIAADFVTLDRWSRLARYSGMNAISGFGVSYQGVFYRTKVLEGLFGRSYDGCRLAALFCEKYGMKYVPEIFGSNATLEQTIRSRSQTPDDLYPMSRQGVKVGPGVDACNFNALHPLVQDFWVEAFGELADKLRDSPAFAGVTVRADVWCYNGFFTLPSIHWGYSDWTMAQFQRQTGVNVPGKAGDASRYAERYKFLTAPEMIGKWNAWRCANINAYHKKIRDRLRGNRDDVFFGVAGDAVSDAINVFPDDPREVWRGAGVDLDKLCHEPGIAIIPTGSYGARNTTESEQANYDTFLNPVSKAIGFGRMRAFAAYMIYHELGARMPYDKLGVKAKNYYYCSAVDAGGRNSLEKFAAVLADQDSSFLRDGGNSYVEGDPAVWRPWFAEFEALPAKPFTPLESARDPIAVWFADLDGAFYFYAVNRERVPLTISLQIKGSGRILSLTSGKECPLEKSGVLRLTLVPYELRAFKCKSGASVVSSDTFIPRELSDFVKQRLAFAQDLADQMKAVRHDDVSDAERNAFTATLSAAREAFQKKWYWRARTALSMAPMMHAYVKLGVMPAGQIVTRFPNKLEEKPARFYVFGEPFSKAEELQKMVSSTAQLELVDSASINPEWGGDKVLKCGGGSFSFDVDVPADGGYLLSIGHVSEQPGDTTVSINGARLAPPMVTRQPKVPEQSVFPRVESKAGKARITLRRNASFGIYAIKWTPVLRPIPSRDWLVAGPFDGFWGNGTGRLGMTDAAVKKGFEACYPPEKNQRLDAIFTTSGVRRIKWESDNDCAAVAELTPLDNQWERVKRRIGVDFTRRAGSPSQDFNFALTHIISPDERTVQLFIGVDWWANAWLNGQRIKSDQEQKAKDSCGCEFNTMYYARAIIKLKPGVNTLLVKLQGGSLGSSFCVWISNQKDISIKADPGK